MAKETSITIALRNGRFINGEYYGPKADKAHQTWTAKTQEEIYIANQLVGAEAAIVVTK